jgi:hypothetical protein
MRTVRRMRQFLQIHEKAFAHINVTNGGWILSNEQTSYSVFFIFLSNKEFCWNVIEFYKDCNFILSSNITMKFIIFDKKHKV